MAMGSAEHDALREQVELYVLGALSAADRAAYEGHLATCDECATQVKALAPVAEALAHAVPQHEPSPALRERVLASVAGRSTVVEAPPAGGGRRRCCRGLRRLRRSFWLSASVCMRPAFGTASVRWRCACRKRPCVRSEPSVKWRISAIRLPMRSLSSRCSPRQTCSASICRANRARRRRRHARSGAGRAGSCSRRPIFRSAPAGKTYQLWVLTKQPAPISAGLFKPDAQGRVAAVFETPTNLPQPVGMAVTIEPEGGVQLRPATSISSGCRRMASRVR